MDTDLERPRPNAARAPPRSITPTGITLPIIEIDGLGRVEVDDTFMGLTPADQDATVAAILEANKSPPPAALPPQDPPHSANLASPADNLAPPPMPADGPAHFSDEWLAEQEAEYQRSLSDQGYRTPAYSPPGPASTTALEAGTLGAFDGITFGFLDELGGVADSVLGGNRKTIWDGTSFSDAYRANVAANRERLAEAQDEHPIAFTVGGVAGGLVPVTGALGGAAKAATALGKLKSAAKAGAAYGAAYGAGSDTGSPLERLDGAAMGGGIGAAGGLVLGGAGQAGSAALSPVARKLLPKLADAQFARQQASSPYAVTDAAVSADLDKIVQTMLTDGAKRKLTKAQRSTLVSRVADLEASYLPAAELKALDVPPSVKARLNAAMAKRHLLSDAEVQALRDGSPAGEAVAAGIERSRRLRAYVSEAAGEGNRTGAALAEALGSAAGWKAAGPIGGAVGGRLGRAAVSRSDSRAAGEALELAGNAERFARLPQVQAAGEPGSAPSDRLTRLSADALDAKYNATKAAQAETTRLEAEGRKVAIANARDNITPSGGWRGLIYERTGLLPAEQDAGALAALKDGAISQEQFRAYLSEPDKLMAGNAGNALVDRLGSMAERGALKRDAKWSPPAHVSRAAARSAFEEADAAWRAAVDADSLAFDSTGADRLSRPTAAAVAETFARREAAERAFQGSDKIHNPVAYAATANGNQRRVSDTLAATLSDASLPQGDREAIASAITSLGNTSQGAAAERIVADTLGRVDAANRERANALLSPLVAQIRR